MTANKGVFLSVLLAMLLVIPVGAVSVSGGGGEHTLTAAGEHGTVFEASTGDVFTTGTVQDSIELVFSPNPGHEFIEWTVSGDCTAVRDGYGIRISEMKEDVLVTANTRNYSTSQELFTVVDVKGMPRPGETLVNSWSFRSTELERTGMQWKGMPCTPLIVGDVAYVRAAGVLYAIDIASGTIIKHVLSEGMPDYYHYISYGNGVIFDTMGHKAYDLDLNYLYDIPADLKYASFHEGYFYGCLSTEDHDYYKMYKTSVDPDKDVSNGTKMNLFQKDTKYRVFAQWGQFSNVIFKDGYFFFLEADGQTGRQGYRAMTAVDLSTEEAVTVELTGFKGMPWDDGWLSEYNGYFYLTAYTAGLFGGVIPGLEDKRSSVMWVGFDFENGSFGTPEYDELRTPGGNRFQGIASGMEIHNGRGYVNVRALGTDTLGGSDDRGTCLIAYDIAADGRPTPTGYAPSVMTHGGIVVNTAYADEGQMYIYVIPYNSGSQGIYVFTDRLVNGKWELDDHYTYMDPHTHLKEYSSQAIRAGPNGELIYYVDHGYVQCFVSSDRFPINILMMGENYVTVSTEYGSSAGEALKKLYPGSQMDGGRIWIGNKVFNIHGLNEVYGSYRPVSDPFEERYEGIEKLGVTNAIYSQIALVEENVTPVFKTPGEKGWYFFYNGEYEKCEMRDRHSLEKASGKTLFYSETKPESDANLLLPYQRVNRGSSLEISLPAHSVTSYSVSDGGVIEVSQDGNRLTVTGVREDSAKLTITIDGVPYNISVDVFPKVTVDGDRTITESITSKGDGKGGRVDTVRTTITDKDGSSAESMTETYDHTGSLVMMEYHRETFRNSEISQLMEGQLVRSEERESRTTDPAGNVIRHTESRKEIMNRGESNGVSRIDTIQVETDLLTGTLVKTSVIKTSTHDYVLLETEVVTEKDGDVIDEKKDLKASSPNGDVDIVIREGVVAVNVTGEESANLKAMIEALGDTEGMPVTINGGDVLAGFVLDSAADLGADLVMRTGTASIYLGPGNLTSLKGKGDVSFSVTDADASGMTPAQRKAVGTAKVFDIELLCGKESQHRFGRFSVEIACQLEAAEGSELRVWRVDEYGVKTYIDGATYADGMLRFEADHLSYYAAEYRLPDAGGAGGVDNVILIAGAGAAVLGIVALLWFRRG